MKQKELIKMSKEAIMNIALDAIRCLDDSVSNNYFDMEVEKQQSGTWTAPLELAMYLIESTTNKYKVTDKCYNHQYVVECRKLRKSIKL